jgi:hypothetical protein
MERIRIDTDELKAKSKAIETSAGVFSQAGKDILAYAAGLPSYDGQLSNPARAASLEINRQCQDVQGSYINDSQSLTRTAYAFEEVDKSAVEGLATLTSGLKGSVFITTQTSVPSSIAQFSTRSGGIPGVFGWTDDGKTVTLFLFGHVMILDKSKLTEAQLKALEKFEDDIENFYKDLAALALALGVDFAALIVLVGTALESLFTAPADAVPGFGQLKAFGEFLVILGSALGVGVATLACLWEVYLIYWDYSDIVDDWNAIVSSGPVESIR